MTASLPQSFVSVLTERGGKKPEQRDCKRCQSSLRASNTVTLTAWLERGREGEEERRIRKPERKKGCALGKDFVLRDMMKPKGASRGKHCPPCLRADCLDPPATPAEKERSDEEELRGQPRTRCPEARRREVRALLPPMRIQLQSPDPLPCKAFIVPQSLSCLSIPAQSVVSVSR
jgi:hypothetical protein